MNSQHKKWGSIGLLSIVFIHSGAASAVMFIQFIAWLDDDILHQYCSYEECSLKYDIIGTLAWMLIPLVSFLTGYLMYCFIKKIWDRFDDKEVKIAVT